MKGASTNRVQAGIRNGAQRTKDRLVVKGDPEENIPHDELTMDITPRNLGG